MTEKISQRDNYMAFRRALSNGPLRTDQLAAELGIESVRVHTRARTLLRDQDVVKTGYQAGGIATKPQVLWSWGGK